MKRFPSLVIFIRIPDPGEPEATDIEDSLQQRPTVVHYLNVCSLASFPHAMRACLSGRQVGNPGNIPDKPTGGRREPPV